MGVFRTLRRDICGTIRTSRNLNESVNLGTIANGMYLVNVKAGNDHKVFHLVVEQ